MNHADFMAQNLLSVIANSAILSKTINDPNAAAGTEGDRVGIENETQ